MVIQLMRYGADPSIADGEGYRALHLAVLFQHMAVAAYLMAKGQVRQFVSLFLTLKLVLLTVFNNYFKMSWVMSDLLISVLQEVDGPDCNGQTSLMLAAQKIIG